MTPSGKQEQSNRGILFGGLQRMITSSSGMVEPDLGSATKSNIPPVSPLTSKSVSSLWDSMSESSRHDVAMDASTGGGHANDSYSNMHLGGASEISLLSSSSAAASSLPYWKSLNLGSSATRSSTRIRSVSMPSLTWYDTEKDSTLDLGVHRGWQ